VAFTQCEGSSASNVIPPVATAVSNIRVNPDDTVNGVLEYLRDKAKRHDVDVDILYANEPSVVSVTDCKEFNAVCKAVRDTWGCLTSPYLMLACSDSRHYGRVSDKVYKFSAMDLTAEERATIHGHNEAIRLETILRATEFYISLMVPC